jgi:hypothetical protein
VALEKDTPIASSSPFKQVLTDKSAKPGAAGVEEEI